MAIIHGYKGGRAVGSLTNIVRTWKNCNFLPARDIDSTYGSITRRQTLAEAIKDAGAQQAVLAVGDYIVFAALPQYSRLNSLACEIENLPTGLTFDLVWMQPDAGGTLVEGSALVGDLYVNAAGGTVTGFGSDRTGCYNDTVKTATTGAVTGLGPANRGMNRLVVVPGLWDTGQKGAALAAQIASLPAGGVVWNKRAEGGVRVKLQWRYEVDAEW